VTDLLSTTPNQPAAVIQLGTGGRWQKVFRRTFANPATVVGLLLVAMMLIVAIFAPQIAPYSPIMGDLRNDYVKPPSVQHIFGTDDVGRDILSRVIYGSRLTLKIALLAQSASVLIGVILGMLTGFYGGLLDTIIMRIADIVLSFPLLIIAIALVGALGSSENNIIIALALVSWPVITRLTRSQVLSIRESEYVTAARSVGANNFTIMRRHIFPNILTPLVVYATLGIGGVILAEASLSFLGLGSAQQADPSWGKMLTESRSFIRSAWWMPLFPGLAILVTVMGFNLLGDGLRDLLDVRS
jgi:peptide/nickel transport system permease protein